MVFLQKLNVLIRKSHFSLNVKSSNFKPCEKNLGKRVLPIHNKLFLIKKLITAK